MSRIAALTFLTFLLLAPAVCAETYDFYVDLKNYGSYNIEVGVGSTGIVFIDDMISAVSVDTSDWISVDLNVAGKPMHIDMLETHKADLDGDGRNDIAIKLEKLIDGRAELTFSKLVYVSKGEPTSPESTFDVVSTSSGEVVITVLPPKPEPISFEFLLIIVVAILAALGYILYIQKS